MSWTTPTLRSTGDLITASIYNTDIISDLLLLKTSISNDGTTWNGTVGSTQSPTAGSVAYGTVFSSTLNKAGSGTHALFAGVRFAAPTIGAGAAALSEAATVYIDGAPASGSAVYALHVAAGDCLFGGTMYANALGSLGANDVTFYRNNVGQMTLKNRQLDVRGNNTNFDIVGSSSVNNGITFGTNILTIDFADGRVGLGTASPSNGVDLSLEMTVNAALKFSSSFLVSGGGGSSAASFVGTGIGAGGQPGSGTQTGWIRFKDNSGNAAFVPYWQ